MIEIAVHEGNVLDFQCDMLVMKYADGLHGADRAVADRIGFTAVVEKGEEKTTPTFDIGARSVAFLGVGSLADFRYAEIREFGRRALAVAAKAREVETIALTIHGPGYGLDERESFLSLVAGLDDAVRAGAFPRSLKRIAIVERAALQAVRMRGLLASVYPDGIIGDGDGGRPRSNYSESQLSKIFPDRLRIDPRLLATRAIAESDTLLADFGKASEAKPRLFVAMPFADEHSDIWDIAIQESCAANGLVCERIDKEAFVGDIGSEIRKRIGASCGVIVVLAGANPNVMLELGFAWGLGRPTILLAHADEAPPFDVQSQRCLKYTKLHGLRQALTAELGALKQNGTFARN